MFYKLTAVSEAVSWCRFLANVIGFWKHSYRMISQNTDSKCQLTYHAMIIELPGYSLVKIISSDSDIYSTKLIYLGMFAMKQNSSTKTSCNYVICYSAETPIRLLINSDSVTHLVI